MKLLRILFTSVIVSASLLWAADPLVNFKPIETTSVAGAEIIQAPVAPIVSKKIPAELNRPIRVAVFVDVKELYYIHNGEEVHATVSGKNLSLQGKGSPTTAEKKELRGNGKCIAIATTKKQLAAACYPGNFNLFVRNGKIVAINVVGMEDYIKGVVPYEMGALDSSRINALKAQAVAARTYAYKHYGNRESLGFDVYADTKDQVYRGFQSATRLTNSAVEATKGVVMTYEGKFITSYYHSTCGGFSETMKTWNLDDLPYLRTQPDVRPNGSPWCDESSYMKWERKFSDSELISLFKQNAKEARVKITDFANIKSISIADTLPSGRIFTLAVTTDKETFNVLGDKTRWLFKKAGAILPSSFFRIKHENGQWILTGKGFGHGIGMCQMGVRARASAGQSFEEILTHYYPGISLERYE